MTPGASSREQILERVRKGLKRTSGQAVPPLPAPRLRIPEIDSDRRLALFTQRLEALAGKVYRAANLLEAREVFERIRPQGTAVASQSPLLREAGIAGTNGVESTFADEAALRKACAAAACGITAADYGMAETGSLVTLASSESRLVSLLPDVHVAILMRDRLITGLDELYTKIPRPADGSSSMVFITGPSRSADIEMILVRGVHGPRAIHVIVVDR